MGDGSGMVVEKASQSTNRRHQRYIPSFSSEKSFSASRSQWRSESTGIDKQCKKETKPHLFFEADLFTLGCISHVGRSTTKYAC